MKRHLYVGNLARQTTAEDLSQAFSPYGAVVNAWIAIDPETNESRGFGYVEMSDGSDQAVAGLDGSMYRGQSWTVRRTRSSGKSDGPGSEDRDNIPVMAVYQFWGWPLPIIDLPPGEDESWTPLYDAPRDPGLGCRRGLGERRGVNGGNIARSTGASP